jgi:phosphoglycerate dehydrogenase-like enzyme
MHVHLTYTPDQLDFLRTHLNEGVTLSTGDEVPAETVVLVAGRPTKAQLEAAPGLRVLLIPFAGLPSVTHERMANYPQIAVHNLHHNAPMTAEMAIALLMATARYLVPVDRVFRSGDWRPRHEGAPALILDDKSALVLGYGAIGQRVAAVCRALGMDVHAIRRTPSADPHLHTPDELHTLLPETNALICCLPGTPATESMIGATELLLLPRGAVVVNVGRAAVFDQWALYEALRTGHLHGAGLDVWYTYPGSVEARANTLPSDAPFYQLENVVMSPHRSGALNVPESEQRRLRALAVSINAAARGEAIPHPVDVDAGY